MIPDLCPVEKDQKSDRLRTKSEFGARSRVVPQISYSQELSLFSPLFLTRNENGLIGE